jgi:hypothetical protein
MATVNEYQQLAQQCVRWAARAKTEDKRTAFLEIARAWTLAAARVGSTLRSDETLTPPAHQDAASICGVEQSPIQGSPAAVMQRAKTTIPAAMP